MVYTHKFTHVHTHTHTHSPTCTSRNHNILTSVSYPARQNTDFGRNCPPISVVFVRKNSSMVRKHPCFSGHMFTVSTNFPVISAVFVRNLLRKLEHGTPSSMIQAHSAVFPTTCLQITPIFRSFLAALVLFIPLILRRSCLAG